jgi:LmbE family N-acetylglucosaminyl deacetylase
MPAAARRPSLVAVFAHPDDEVFHGGGVFAHLGERGVRVTLVCATAGDAGKVHPSVGPVGDLGAFRMEELKLSCERLGIDPPIVLGFHDSARNERLRRDDPQALANVDLLDVEAAILRVIADVRPHVVVTFDPHGGYYHPDHLAIHRATTAAFFASGVFGEDAPDRLFYSAMLPDVFRALADGTRGRGIVDGLDPDVFATAPEMIALSFVLEREVFVLGGARGPIPRWPLADLFEGLEV